MEIRQAEPKDFVSMAQLENENWPLTSTPIVMKSSAEKIITKITTGTSYYLAMEKGQILGILDFSDKHKIPTGAHVLIFGMMVVKNAEHKGIGQALLHFLLDYARSNHYLKISMEVLSTNPRAIVLYEKMGFHLEGRQVKEFYIHDTWVDNLWYAYFL
jgi:RimJ/RimL family protein N-acetyltransferase